MMGVFVKMTVAILLTLTVLTSCASSRAVMRDCKHLSLDFYDCEEP